MLTVLLLTGCTKKSSDTRIIKVGLRKENPDGKTLWKFATLQNGVVAQSGKIQIFSKDLVGDPVIKELIKNKEKIDKQVKAKAVSKDYYQKLGVETKIFHRKLELIEDKIKDLAFHQEAKKRGISIQKYIEEYVYSQFKSAITEDEKESLLKERAVPKHVDREQWIAQEIFNKKRKRVVKYILEKHVLSLPILVSLKRPAGQLEIKDELTPYWGPKNASHKVILYSGGKSFSERNLLKNLKVLFNKYKGLYVGYRPIVTEKGSYEKLGALFQFCVWRAKPELFWSFLEKSVDVKTKNENAMIGIVESMKIKKTDVTNCIYENPFAAAFDYHYKYNQYLGISSGPVVYINGEVLYGAVKIGDIKVVLDRQIQAKTAALWD